MSTNQPKPKFEPPPWEQEAFERFQKAREEARVREDLDAALRVVRDEARDAEASPTPLTPSTTESPRNQPEAGEETAPVQEGIPEAQIDSMIIQLRGEEPRARVVNRGLVNGVIGFLAVAGIFTIIESALLFGDVGAVDAENTMLATTLSLVVLLTGLGFLGGAFLLFRKYHQ